MPLARSSRPRGMTVMTQGRTHTALRHDKSHSHLMQQRGVRRRAFAVRKATTRSKPLSTELVGLGPLLVRDAGQNLLHLSLWTGGELSAEGQSLRDNAGRSWQSSGLNHSQVYTGHPWSDPRMFVPHYVFELRAQLRLSRPRIGLTCCEPAANAMTGPENRFKRALRMCESLSAEKLRP